MYVDKIELVSNMIRLADELKRSEDSTVASWLVLQKLFNGKNSQDIYVGEEIENIFDNGYVFDTIGLPEVENMSLLLTEEEKEDIIQNTPSSAFESVDLRVYEEVYSALAKRYGEVDVCR